jgi:TetR/AcrR family transcriptional regulator
MVIQAWMAADKITVQSPHHLLYTIWASCQHYADFSAQIEQLNNQPMVAEDYTQAAKNLIHIILKGCDLAVPKAYM